MNLAMRKDDDDYNVPWRYALRRWGISITSAYRRLKTDPEFAKMRFALYRGPGGKATYYVRKSDVEAYLEKLKEEQQ